MLILSRGCRKLDEACAGRCEGKGWRHDCQRANYNVFFFWGFYFQQHFFVFSSALPMPRDCLMYLFYFSLLFFLNQAWIRGKKEIHERKNRQRMKRHSHGFAKQANTTRFLFFFFAILFCLCILFFSSVASPLVCSLSLFFFFQFSIFQYSHSLALLHCVCVIARTRSDY